MNDQLRKRLKSFAWRTGGMIAVVSLSIITSNLEILELPEWAVVLTGLAVGELTKWLNNMIKTK